MIFYFSGTGNSLKAAQIFENELNDEIVFMSRENEGMEVNSERIGFIVPVYCFDIPEFLEEFIKSLTIPESTYCYAIANCGAEAGNTLNSIDKILKEKGNKLNYGKNLILPDNCGPVLDHKPDLSPLVPGYENLKKFAKEIKNKAEDREDVFLNEELIDKINMSKKHVEKEWTFKEVMEDRCTLCNKCVELCPTNNIKRNNDKITIGDDCINCLACIHWCPDQAVKFKEVILEADDSYVNPDISFKDMLQTR